MSQTANLQNQTDKTMKNLTRTSDVKDSGIRHKVKPGENIGSRRTNIKCQSQRNHWVK